MKVKLFDTSWDLYDIEEFNQLFLEHIKNNTKLTVASLNLHCIYLYYKIKEVKGFVDSSAIHIDGMPVVWMLKMAGYKNITGRYRITWVDWMMPLLTFFRNNNLTVFYLGGKPGVASKAMDNITEKIPGLVYETRNGYFNAEPNGNQDNLAVIEQINKFKPNLLIVGMGMGRQEKWLYENRDKIDANIIITSGAAAEYFSGDVNTPPRWMGRTGLEWLYRLGENPRRFAFRYLVEPWFILGLYARRTGKK